MPTATPETETEKSYEEMTSAEKRKFTKEKNEAAKSETPDEVAAMFGDDVKLPGVPRPEEERDGSSYVDIFAARKVEEYDEDTELIQVQQVPVPVPEMVEIPIPRRGDWVLAGVGDNAPEELAMVTNVKKPGRNYKGRVDLSIHGHGAAGIRPVEGAYYAHDPRFKDQRAKSPQFEVPATWVAFDKSTINKLVLSYKDLLERVKKLEK